MKVLCHQKMIILFYDLALNVNFIRKKILRIFVYFIYVKLRYVLNACKPIFKNTKNNKVRLILKAINKCYVRQAKQ